MFVLHITFHTRIPVLQIRRDNKGNSEIFSLILNENIRCHPHLNRLSETVLMTGHNVCFNGKK